MSKMLEVLISAKAESPIEATICETEIPTPEPNEVLVKVMATDSNPKDWKHPLGLGKAINSGDDISGIVAKVGSLVDEFKPGDRVAAFHRMGASHGSYAEYALAPAKTTFRLPSKITFEEGATLPLAAMTAALGIFKSLSLPTPWSPVPPGQTLPLLIYGGASSVGAFALKFAKLAGLNPIITVAGESQEFVANLKAADYIIDYRQKNVVADIKKALGGLKLRHAFDVTCEHGSWQNILEVLAKDGEKSYINMLDIPNDLDTKSRDWPSEVELSRTYVSTAYGQPHRMRTEKEAAEDGDFAYIFYRYMSLLLQDGRLLPHPYEVLPGGLTAVGKGIQMLYDKKVHGKKLVYRIADTPGLRDRH